MGFKRKIRNILGWSLGFVLVLLGYINKAKKESFKKNVITSIYFHNPNKKLFEKIIKWLEKNDYIFISSDQLINILRENIPCPRGAVWISLDDGWKGNICNVIPVIRKHNIPITIFISTAAIEEGMFWWTKVKRYSNYIPINFRSVEQLMKVKEDIREEIIQSINKQILIKDNDRVSMNIEDIRYISKLPQVIIGSHTVNHPILPNCTKKQLEYELKESKLRLEKWIAKEVNTFSYPNGDFNGQEKEYLSKYGYELAATTESRFGYVNDDPYLIPRNCVMNNGSFLENLCHMLGVWQPIIAKIKKGVENVK